MEPIKPTRSRAFRAAKDVLCIVTPRVLVMHTLSEMELDSITSWGNSIWLACFGITFGAFICLITTIFTVEIADVWKHATFVVMCWATGFASVLFAILAFIEYRKISRRLKQLKKVPAQPE